MKHSILSLSILSVLAACSPSHTHEEAETHSIKEAHSTKKAPVVKTDSAAYISISQFNPKMASFIGLEIGESFASADPKIQAVFKAYDGHAEPLNIDVKSDIVEAGWKQVLVTQDGLMDGTVTGQQLLAIFDEDQKLITYGIRIKCHSDSGDTDWQKTVCE
ncbi:MAG: hypothetical protein ABJG88_11160 [Litorimonas sp.]